MTRPPGRTRTGTWIAGLACVLALAYIALNALSADAPGSRGLPAGQRLPPFAMPLALSRGRELDANVATRPGHDRVEALGR